MRVKTLIFTHKNHRLNTLIKIYALKPSWDIVKAWFFKTNINKYSVKPAHIYFLTQL